MGACHFDVASDPFKCHFGDLMWLHSALKKSSWTYKKQKVLIKHECSDVLVECEKLAGVSRNVCEAWIKEFPTLDS